MNLYEIFTPETKEKVWIASNTIIQAIKVLCEFRSIDITELDSASRIVIIPPSHWHDMHIQDDNAHGHVAALSEIMLQVKVPKVIGESF